MPSGCQTLEVFYLGSVPQPTITIATSLGKLPRNQVMVLVAFLGIIKYFMVLVTFSELSDILRMSINYKGYHVAVVVGALTRLALSPATKERVYIYTGFRLCKRSTILGEWT